ncbi:hypothetical protein Tco_0714811, partial [Tanacetum coccineum]
QQKQSVSKPQRSFRNRWTQLCRMSWHGKDEALFAKSIDPHKAIGEQLSKRSKSVVGSRPALDRSLEDIDQRLTFRMPGYAR